MQELDEAVRRATGARPLAYTPRAGGYSTADRYAVELADGRSVFVKSSATPNLAGWIRREHEVYGALAGSFMPELLGFDDDGERATLVLEDLSGADWEVRWDAARVDAVRAALAELSASPPPPDTPQARDAFSEFWDRWGIVESDSAPFLSLGLRDEAWLERALPALRAAVSDDVGTGDRVCHMDLRSDNLCFRDGRAIFVDWNWTCLADPRLDLAGWAPSLHCEGGPPPWEMLEDAGALAALIAGVWAAIAGLPPLPTAPNVRALQRRQLAVALDWIDRDLL